MQGIHRELDESLFQTAVRPGYAEKWTRCVTVSAGGSTNSSAVKQRDWLCIAKSLQGGPWVQKTS